MANNYQTGLAYIQGLIAALDPNTHYDNNPHLGATFDGSDEVIASWDKGVKDMDLTRARLREEGKLG